ncbi:MAG: N-acetyl-D-glucosamine ABC transporter, permease protein 1 [uncultured Thermomicrobiales bacterium]|uniref:N-acetyl-D-glucosamine ABC transporter, permease protein 1 n=1 Tax=uncultured Thermomicrobiales bacterium TaxID=1645740 RepID=A0A6J4VEI4_9BACT|nr:MAG: N-acetyl-D-glucosamine ABC transporter, permease protein 1 [uncultured Thermomicrobiales bacterium]
MVGLLVLTILPALAGLPLAFTRYNAIERPVWHGLQNFTELAGDDIFRIAVQNSLVFIAISIPLRIVAALGLSLLLSGRFRGVGLYRAAVYLPTVVPDIAWAVVWLWVLNPLYGPLNQLLAVAGVAGPAWTVEENSARAAIILMMGWQIGETFVICLAGLQDVPGELLDQSAVDGAGPWQTFRSVLLPSIAPVLLIVMFRDTIASLQTNFVPALIVGRDGGPNYATTYLPLYIYRNAFDYLRFGYAAAMTWSLIGLTGVVVYLQYRVAVHWRMGFRDAEV